MGDIFKEQIVKRKPKSTDGVKFIGLVFGVLAIFIVSMMIIPSFAMVPTLLAGFGAFYVCSFLKVEYEYIFTNGDLDIDIIYNRSRRKRMFSANVKSIEIMAHIEDMNHAGSFSGAQQVLDFSSGATEETTYAFLIAHKGQQTKVIIEPNETMMDALKGSIPRSKLHIKR